MTSDAYQTTMLAEMAAELWAMEPHRLQALFSRLSRMGDKVAAVAQIQVQQSQPKLSVINGTAVIPIKGILLKTVPSWMAFFGIDASSYGQIAALVSQAAAAADVKQIRLEIDSPGGTVAGVLDAARAIKTARASKPVTAQVQDLAASAAYWLASQAQSIAADLNAEVGSIGVYTVYYDASQMAAQDGVKVHVIASGEHKGMGVFGAPITDAQIAAMREVIDGIAGNFVQAVADGRGLPLADAQALATGRLWEAKAALSNKLIDSLGEAASAGASSNATSQSSIPQSGDQPMENQNQQAQSAAPDTAAIEAKGRDAERKRLAEFKAAFPDDLEYAVTSHESGMSLDAAKATHALMLKRTQNAAVAATGADGRIGQQNAEGNESASAGPDFLAVSRQYAAEHRCSMTEAMQAVRRAQPQLHEQYLSRCLAQGRPVRGKVERVKA
jgi:signal peptide peptidase SppA